MRRCLASFIILWLSLSPVGLLAQEKTGAKGSQTKITDQQPDTAKPASHTRVRFGGFTAGAYWSSFPYPYPYWYSYYIPYSYAASFGWAAYWPYSWGPYSWFYPPVYWTDASANGGKVKIDSSREDAELLIDGAYAGFLKDLKNISLAPGAYNLEIRAPGQKPYEKRIYVLSGRTVSVTPVFETLPEVTQ